MRVYFSNAYYLGNLTNDTQSPIIQHGLKLASNDI